LLSASALQGQALARGWLESFKEVSAPLEEAERLAWWAYRNGDWQQAEEWLASAPDDAPLAQWLRAKLLLRKGEVDAALPLIASAADHFPPWQELRITRDIDLEDAIFDGYRARAEIGSLELARGEYIAALDALLSAVAPNEWQEGGELQVRYARHWLDAAYVAEQVLSVDELRAFVERRWPTQEIESSAEPRAHPGPDMRYLLARRLAREGRLHEAAPYFPESFEPEFQEYATAMGVANDPVAAPSARAAALWNAAQLARQRGLELLGTETDPDWAALGGNFDLGVNAEQRPKEGLSRPATDEMTRARSQRPAPDRRFHYRWVAADLAWKAALLMPDQSPETARILAVGGSWIKTLDPRGADRFYKALVRRCGNTELGKKASKIGWFPEV